ncbi:uncharacterized protein [Medicago truncatula]|uniref:uncharacterized protein n=1 Tax=Medicago truncatula TaxID=3880 RepID=UPI0019681C2E|nr:uncharacterized protein LOC120577345 [Medicago truncatula]
MLLGLPFGGSIVTAPPTLPWNLCAHLLGITPPAHKTDGFTLSLSWLKDNLVDNNFNEQSPPEVKIQHTRRYLLYLFGGFLFPNTTGLFVHTSWLSLLMDFNETRRYSWGSAVLAYLYRGLCEASHPNIKALNGCHFLLQVWGYFRLSHIAPRNDNPLQWPLGLKWTGVGSRYYENPSHDTISYRKKFDDILPHDFKWRPYKKVPYMRQFHTVDKRFKTWYQSNGFRFPIESQHWDNRRSYTLPRMQPRSLTPSHAYIEWLTTTCNPRLRISVETKPSDSDPDEQEEPEPEHEPEIHNNQTPIHDDFWDQDIFSQLQDHQSQPHTTQNIHGSVMYEFLDTPQQNIIQPPPYTSPRNAYEPQYQSTYQQNSMPNYGYNDPNQATTSNNNYFSYNDPNQAGPSNTNYPPTTAHNTQCTPTKTTTIHQHQQTYYLTSLRLRSTTMNNFWILDGKQGNTMCRCHWVMVVKYNQLQITMTKTNMTLK